MLSIRVCPDDPVMKLLRQNFNATPLKTPDNSVQPLSVIGWTKKKADRKGALQELLLGDEKINVNIFSSDMQQFSSSKTKKLNLNIGIKLVSSFLEGFGIQTAPLTAAFEGARQVSISFESVKRYYIDKNELGKVLSQHQLDLNNLNLYSFKNEDATKFMLVNSVITSPKFTVNVEKSNDTNFEIDLKMIDGILDAGEGKVKINSEQKNKVSFAGDSPLTFAFTSCELVIDWHTGKFIGIKDTTKDVPVPLGDQIDDPENNWEQTMINEDELLILN